MRRKLLEQIKTVEALAPQRQPGGACTAVGTIVDRDGYLSMRAILNYGIGTGTNSVNQTITAVLYDSASSAGSNASAYNTAAFSLAITATETGGSTSASDEIDLSGAARYIQLRLTGTNTISAGYSAPISAVFVLGDAAVEPAT